MARIDRDFYVYTHMWQGEFVYLSSIDLFCNSLQELLQGGKPCDRGWIKAPGRRTGKIRARIYTKKDFDYYGNYHSVISHYGHCSASNYMATPGTWDRPI